MRYQYKGDTLNRSVSLTEEEAEALGQIHKRMSHMDYKELAMNPVEIDLMKQASLKVLAAIRSQGPLSLFLLGAKAR